METKSENIKIRNKLGLHARPASLFVRIASAFNSDIQVKKDGESVDGKSLISLLMLAAGYDTSIKIIAKGNDSQLAVDKLVDLVLNDPEFNEELK